MLKKILRYTLYLFLLILAIILGAYLYFKFEEQREKELELGFQTKFKWEWENEYARVQIRYIENMQRSVLRKVNISENYVIYAYKNDDYTLSTLVEFPTKCKPNTTITTTEKFSNGEPKTLTCDSDGNSLGYEVLWNTKEPITSWSENLNGYKFEIYFYSWNFDKLDREITLKKAK